MLPDELGCLLVKIEQALEGEVKEVAAAASGVEDADGGELGEPASEDAFRLALLKAESTLRFGFTCGGGFLFDFEQRGSPDILPALFERLHHEGLDAQKDVF
jgi:hypothetical protein